VPRKKEAYWEQPVDSSPYKKGIGSPEERDRKEKSRKQRVID
jgi:hypothetical protein